MKQGWFPSPPPPLYKYPKDNKHYVRCSNELIISCSCEVNLLLFFCRFTFSDILGNPNVILYLNLPIPCKSSLFSCCSFVFVVVPVVAVNVI